MATLRRLDDSELAQRGHTHVVVIGVGSYDFMRLPGQVEPAKEGGRREVQVLEQLTSPQHSARAFIDWVLDLEANNLWRRKLGSLRVLIGSGGFADNGLAIGGDASLSEIKRQVRGWREDVAKHPDNVAVFFFCGHGEMQAGQSFVLAQDFGHKDDTFWGKSINISEFVSRMQGVECKNQMYFVDACRVSTESWADFAPTDADPLVDRTQPLLKTLPPVLFSVPPDKQAFGMPDTPSQFTKVLLECLNGYTAFRTSNNRPWYATQASICDAVREVGNALLNAESITPEGTPISKDPIYWIPVPKVHAIISSDPPSILGNNDCLVTLPDKSVATISAKVPPIPFPTISGKHLFRCDVHVKEEFAVPPILNVDLP